MTLPDNEQALWERYQEARRQLYEPFDGGDPCPGIAQLLAADAARRFLRIALANGYSRALVERFRRCIEMELGDTCDETTGGTEQPGTELLN